MPGSRPSVSRGGHHAIVVGVAVVIGTYTGPASADIEWSTGLLAGPCGVGDGGAVWNRAAGCLGARVEIDERGGPRKVGYGGFLTTTTTGFRDVAASGGGTLVLPWDDPWTVTVSAGPLLLHRDAAWWPGAAAWGFVGWRGFNYHGSYAMAWGFTVGYERAFAGPSTLTMGVELDGLVLALPAMLVIEAIRGPRD